MREKRLPLEEFFRFFYQQQKVFSFFEPALCVDEPPERVRARPSDVVVVAHAEQAEFRGAVVVPENEFDAIAVPETVLKQNFKAQFKRLECPQRFLYFKQI